LNKIDYEIITKAYNLIELQKYKEALESLQTILENSPIYEDTLNCQFKCYSKLGDLKKAKGTLDIALNRFPNSAQVHANSCSYYMDKVDYKNAVESIKRAIELEPTNSYNLCQLVLLYIPLNKIKLAKAVFEKAEILDPNSLNTIYTKAELLSSDDDISGALKQAKRGLTIDPNNIAFNSLYVSLLKRNPKTIKLAEETAIHALTIDPTDEEARSNLLDVYKNKNRLLKFFVGNAFGRFVVEWTVWRVIIMVLFWKATLIWGAFGILYLIITWYCGVLYNTFTRLHYKYKLLLTESDIMQSNMFLFMNGLLLLFIIIGRYFSFEEGAYPAIIVAYSTLLLIGISYYEIVLPIGKKQFLFFIVVWLIIISFACTYPIALIIFSILLLLIYAFIFTLNLAFR